MLKETWVEIFCRQKCRPTRLWCASILRLMGSKFTRITYGASRPDLFLKTSCVELIPITKMSNLDGACEGLDQFRGWWGQNIPKIHIISRISRILVCCRWVRTLDMGDPERRPQTPQYNNYVENCINYLMQTLFKAFSITSRITRQQCVIDWYQRCCNPGWPTTRGQNSSFSTWVYVATIKTLIPMQYMQTHVLR